jgi:outer membrane protein
MSEEVKRQKEEEIMNKEKEVREMQKNKFGPEGELFKKRQELVRPIQDQVYKAIEEYANTKGFDFIFDKGGSTGIIFANAKFDKTEDILKEIKGE